MITRLAYRCLLLISWAATYRCSQFRPAGRLTRPRRSTCYSRYFLADRIAGFSSAVPRRRTSGVPPRRSPHCARKGQTQTGCLVFRSDRSRWIWVRTSARSAIRDAFDVALETDLAVAIHLDDYMFWAQARTADGRPLRSIPGTAEWTDWSGTPAGSLQIGFLPNAGLGPADLL